MLYSPPKERYNQETGQPNVNKYDIYDDDAMVEDMYEYYESRLPDYTAKMKSIREVLAF